MNCFRAFNSSLVASFNDGPPDDESTLADHLDKISCYQGGKNMNFVYPVVERNGEFPGTQWNNFHFGISDTSEYGFVLQNFNNCNDLNAFPIALSVKQEYCEDHGQIDGEECEWINNKCELNGGLHWQEVSASVSTDDQGKRQFSSLYDVAAKSCNGDDCHQLGQSLSSIICRFPWFPRGQVVDQSCSTSYISDSVLVSPAVGITVNPPNDFGSRGCSEMCTHVAECTGYISEMRECTLVLALDFNNDRLHEHVGKISRRVPVAVTQTSGLEILPVVSNLGAGTAYTRKSRRRRQGDQFLADGPWLVHGYTDRRSIADGAVIFQRGYKNMVEMFRNIIVTSQTTTLFAATPEECGVLCSETAGCLYAIWAGRDLPCFLVAFSGLFGTAVTQLRHVSDTVSKSPSRCAELSQGFGTSYSEDARDTCHASLVCTYTRLVPIQREEPREEPRYGCIDLYVPRGFEPTFSVVDPDLIPVVFAVPNPVVHALSENVGGAAWCTPGSVCHSCNADESPSVPQPRLFLPLPVSRK